MDENDRREPAADGEEAMVNWRGNWVPEREGIALKHVFDEMKDYFGQPENDPKVNFKINNLHQTADDPNMWRGEVEFTYQIERNPFTLDYMSIDVCIDLTPKTRSANMEGYCTTWLYAYLPSYTMEKIEEYFEVGTGWKPSRRGSCLDENRNIVHFESQLNVHPQPEPSFWVANDEEKKKFTRIGTIREAAKDPANHFIFRCIGIFMVTAEVQGHSGVQPRPGFGNESSLTFTLVSARTLGVVDSVAPIVYRPRR
ncbi:hypothetical protein ACHAWC_009349 [Mediolabrus comicus]|jgi:hypothetical protein